MSQKPESLVPFTSQTGHPFNEFGLMHPAWRAFNKRFHPNPGIAEMSLDLEDQLNKLYLEWSSNSAFPRNQCISTSDILSTKFGLGRETGYFLLDKPLGLLLPLAVRHWWNYDRRGRIVDMTYPQYRNGLHYPAPDNIGVFTPQDADYWRYLPDNHPIATLHRFDWDQELF